MDDLIGKLKAMDVGIIKEKEPLANHTTMKVGGPADLLIEPSSIDSLKRIVALLNEHGVSWTAIGRGSNLLVSDLGIQGVVIKLGKGLGEMEIDGTKVRVGAGYSLVSLSTQISRKGLAGLEFASGIPGSVGGAVYMNAGAHGSDISQVLEKAHILFADGTMGWLTKEEMQFTYRTSVLQKTRPGIVLEAVFSLKEGERDAIFGQMQRNKDYRKETQPWNYPCSGSIFRNPLPNYAGKLIQDAGLKGFSIGGAQVSDMHGNFIVNTGNATANDVAVLIEEIQRKIYELYEVKLETEVEIIGRK